MRSYHLTIHGKVQGVGYRVSARKKAIEYGITGWIMNTPEHHVQILAQGSEEQIQKFIEWCRQGPSFARVDQLYIEISEELLFDAFQIRH